MPSINITWEQAAKLNIVFCGNCGHRPNNHFQWDKKPCAHCKCQELKLEIFLPEEER